jgi:hypothetical protein
MCRLPPTGQIAGTPEVDLCRLVILSQENLASIDSYLRAVDALTGVRATYRQGSTNLRNRWTWFEIPWTLSAWLQSGRKRFIMSSTLH